MEHLTPAELLRFLEEEANTLRLMHAKIANQLHCLQVEEEFFSRQLSNLEKGHERTSALRIESDQSGQDVNGNIHNEASFQNEIQSEELELQSPAVARSTDQALGSSPKLLESPGTQNCSGADGQEPSETIELGNDHGIQMELQGQQQEQEVLQEIKPSLPQRDSGRRISRRPARFQD